MDLKTFTGVLRARYKLIVAVITLGVELTHAIAAAQLFEPAPEVIVTAGGSAYFDVVVDHFSRVEIDLPVRVVIRPGCYISHDDGTLHSASPMGACPRTAHDERLLAAIEVWGVVLSRPEPGLAAGFFTGVS